jgi:DNA-binding NtrC family response regulator
MSLPDTILLVEDDDSLRLMLRGVLEMQGFSVLEADCRNSGLEVLETHSHVGVVLLDLGLPPSPHTPSEGLAFLRHTCDITHPVKVIVLTGQDQESAALEAIKDGAFDFLVKPATSSAILQAVRRAFLFCHKEQEMAAGGFARVQVNARISDGLKVAREEVEEKLVRHVLRETGFNVNQSAVRLGLKRESIYYFLKKFGIERQDG